MSAIATALKHMLAAGMPHDAIVAAVAEMEAALTPSVDPRVARKRERDRDRMAAYRAHPTPWPELRLAVFERDGWTCVYCGSIDDLHCDHVQPLSAGGLHDQSNLATACHSCNLSKGARAPAAWRAQWA